MSGCGPGGNNVGWGVDIPVTRVGQIENWTSIIRSTPAKPSEEGTFGVVTLANRTVSEGVQTSAVETVGLLRFGSGGDSAQLEFDWIEGNQFSVAGSSFIEVLAKVIDVSDEELSPVGTVLHPSAFVSWQTNRPANNAPLQRSHYLTVAGASGSALFKVPPLATSYYVVGQTPNIVFAMIRGQGIDSQTASRTTQVTTVTEAQPVPLVARSRYVQLVNLDPDDVDLVLVFVYAL